MKSARELRDAALSAAGKADGVRQSRPIPESGGSVAVLLHRYGIGANGNPTSGPPGLLVRLDPRSGVVLSKERVSAEGPVRRLFPPTLVPIGPTVVESTSEEANREAHAICDRLQPRVFELFWEKRSLTEAERELVRAFDAAFWQVLWLYELPAHRLLGADFLRWLNKNGGTDPGG